ncbi:hypothetical protein ABZV34_04710 [Streptomyces sp. NPDC005195]|uniref:hypothetical protein n=1 Tax=Streptomyces sp. NPDC005195 TaxID=3154561 RepID=UPI0033A5E892
MTETGEPELTVYHRHLAQLLKRDAGENFRALLVQARHITGTSYETNLYDHQQAFRLLWRHLERSGHLRRAHRDAHTRLAPVTPRPTNAPTWSCSSPSTARSTRRPPPAPDPYDPPGGRHASAAPSPAALKGYLLGKEVIHEHHCRLLAPLPGA